MKKAKYTGKEMTIVGVVEEIEQEDGDGVIIAKRWTWMLK